MGHLFLQVWGKMGHLHILLIKYHKGKMGHPKVRKFYQQKNRGWGENGSPPFFINNLSHDSI